jgi:hypothetical protein
VMSQIQILLPFDSIIVIFFCGIRIIQVGGIIQFLSSSVIADGISKIIEDNDQDDDTKDVLQGD